MRAAALGACLWLGTAAFAQPPDDTVQWNAALSSSAPISPGGIASITVTGTIANGWHVYALEQLPGGPTPLLLSLADSTLASAEGPPSGSKPSTVFDKRFGLKTQFYTGTVTVQLPVRLTGAQAAGSQQLTVKVRFQSCSAQECRPPATVRLSVPLQVSAHE